MRKISDSGKPLADGPTTTTAAPMRKLIQSKTTKQFLTRRGGWTDEIESAAAFPDSYDARDAIQQHHLRDVALYYSFNAPDTRYDFTITL